MASELLVTGYGGFVAGSVVAQAGDDWKVTAVSRSVVPDGPTVVSHRRFDLCDGDRLRQLFAELRPDAVIHAAALADIDYCEANRDEAFKINVDVTDHIAKLCAEYDTRLILCSTDAVFDGRQGGYDENDVPRPLSVYAETKVAGEQAVLARGKGMIVARLALVTGLPLIGAGNSFMARMIASLEDGKDVAFPENEVRTPIDVITLGRSLLELAGGDYSGILHLAGSSRLDRYAMGVRIATRLGYAAERIASTHSNEIAGRAARPDDASLNNPKARQVLDTPMLEFDAALDLVIANSEYQSR